MCTWVNGSFVKALSYFQNVALEKVDVLLGGTQVSHLFRRCLFVIKARGLEVIHFRRHFAF